MRRRSLMQYWWAIEDLLDGRLQTDIAAAADANREALRAADERAEALIADLTVQVSGAVKRLDAVEAALRERAATTELLAKALMAKVERSQTAIEMQMDRATALFAGQTRLVGSSVASTEASATEARKAAEAIEAALTEFRQVTSALEASLPELAERAVRRVIEQVEQEEGVLALALANVTSFTRDISKTLERDQ